MKKLMTIICLLSLTTLAGAENLFKDIRIDRHSIEKEGSDLKVELDIVLDDLKIGTQQSITITPVIYSEDRSVSKKLSPVTIAGKTRMKAYQREEALGNETIMSGAIATLRRKNNSEQSIAYSENIPFEKWMYDGAVDLYFEEDGCYLCGDKQYANQTTPLASPIVPRHIPSYVLIGGGEPEPEVKYVDTKGSASIRFRVNRYNIDEKYMGNRTELDAIIESIQKVIDNPYMTIEKIGVAGYASVEGPESFNWKLSENRAKALALYLQKIFKDIDTSDWDVEWYGEDWKGTLDAISAQIGTYGEEIIRVIADTTGKADARERLLIRTAGNKLYTKMLREEFPAIRRLDYTVSYTIRPFDIEEAVEIAGTDPQLLSANEMYQVAARFDKTSEEYERYTLLNAEIHSDNAQAVLNAAMMLAFEKDDKEGALRVIENYRGETNADIINTKGVILSGLERYEEARECFRSISDTPDGAENLEQIEIVIEQL